MKIKDIFMWPLSEAAVTEMTKTVRDNNPNKININKLYSLFRRHVIPEKYEFYSRADFFGILRETNETAEDAWTRKKLQAEKTVSSATLIASKI